MTHHQTPWRNVISVIVGAAIVIIAISSTIGREIYSGKDPGIIWFAIVHFLGYLFFLLMPVEMAFVYYEQEVENSSLILITALSTAVLAQIIDFLIGYFFSAQVIKNWIGKRRYIRAKNRIQKYGNPTIFFFNLLPLSSPIIALAAGMIKYDWKKWLLYSTLGLFIKYILLSIIF